MNEKMLSIKDVAERLNIGERAVRNLIYSDELPALRIGGIYRVKESELNTFLENSLVKNNKEEEQDNE